MIQIAGAEPNMMAEAARRNVELGAEVIDINMGCPAKKVCNKAAGSALLKDEVLVASILQSVVEAVPVPVTLKIRLGWSRESQNADTIAALAEQAGIQMLTIHGRTRACRFTGTADYDAIGSAAERVSIPVIANGDITSVQQASKLLQDYPVAGVMIGRAAQASPWLPGMIAAHLRGEAVDAPDAISRKASLLQHVQRLSEFYGEYLGVRIARKHVGWQLKPRFPELVGQFNRLESLSAQLDLLDASLQPGLEAAA